MLLHILCSRRNQPRKWILVLAALPFFYLGFMGGEYGSLPLYFTGGALIIAQVFYPTLLMWSLLALLYSGASLACVYVFVGDVLRLFAAELPTVLLDTDDSVAFLVFLAYIILVTIGLLLSRPNERGKPPEIPADERSGTSPVLTAPGRRS